MTTCTFIVDSDADRRMEVTFKTAGQWNLFQAATAAGRQIQDKTLLVDRLEKLRGAINVLKTVGGAFSEVPSLIAAYHCED